MNIEEERKAFELNGFPSPLIAIWLTFAEGVYIPLREKQSIHSQKLADHCNKLFPVWLAAKAHAAEMAKPTCEVYHLTTGWAVDPICRDHYEGFASKEEAIQWAKDNGYRVIE